MVTAVPPTHLTPKERLDEVAEILANGILRLRQRRAQQSADREPFRLDKPLDQCLYRAEKTTRSGGST